MSIDLLGKGFEEFGGKSDLVRGIHQRSGSRWELDLQPFALWLRLIELGNYESVGGRRSFWAKRGLSSFGDPRGKGGIFDSALLGKGGAAEAALFKSGKNFVTILLRVMSPPNTVGFDDSGRDFSRLVR